MPNVDLERIQNLYDSGSYQKNTNNWEDSTGLQRARALIRSLRGNMSGIASVLDVGCGSGGVIRRLHCIARLEKEIFTQNVRIVGCDPSEQAISLSRSLSYSISDIEYRHCLLEDFHFSAEKFDLVLLIHVLEHVPDMLEMIESSFRLSRHVYINVPIEATILYALRPGVLAAQYTRYGHIHFFDESFFRKFLESNGFCVLYSGHSYDYRGQSRTLPRAILYSLRMIVALIFGPSISNKLLGGISATYLITKRT